MTSSLSSTQQIASVVAAGCTDIGCGRKENQDTWLVDEERGVFVVSDGVGGGPVGGTASQMVTSTLPSLIAQRSTVMPQRPRARAVRCVLRDSLLELSRDIRKVGENDPGRKGMGATVVAVWLRWPFAHIAHMGDSRAYLFRAGILTPLTSDHSIVALLLRNGEITAADVQDHPARNRLTRFVGMDGDVYPETQSLRLEAGDRLLLCTDGLWSAASDAEMKALLSSHPDPRIACRELVALAKRHGGQDNITAVVVSISEVKR